MGKVRKSPWVLHYDGSSCNGCDIEVLACLTPVYDAERFGIINTGDPLQADIFLITGGINTQNRAVVEQLYDQMPRPKVVVAVGTCACTGGIFKECYNILGGADTTVPVDIYVPGCAARPQAIIDGLIQAIELFQKRSNRHEQIERRLAYYVNDKKLSSFTLKTSPILGAYLSRTDGLFGSSYLGKWKKKYKCKITLTESSEFTVLQNEFYTEKGEKLD